MEPGPRVEILKTTSFWNARSRRRRNTLSAETATCLVLEKPFGIQIVTPRRFLSVLGQHPSPRAA